MTFTFKPRASRAAHGRGQADGLSAPRSTMAAPAGTAALAALGACAALLAGCAQTPPKTQIPQYAQPADGQPQARVVVRAALPVGHGMALLHLKDDAQCKQPELMLRGQAGKTPEPLRLVPGELVTLDFIVTFPGTQRGCVNRWSFTPQAGSTYLIQAAVVGTKCPARLQDVTQADQPVTPTDLVTRVARGKTCLPVAESPKVPQGLLQGGQDDNGEPVLLPQATDEPLKGLIP